MTIMMKNDRLQRMCQSRRMHYADEGPDDPTTEDGPCLAPSTPLSHALTILGIRHQCAVKVKVDRDSDSESLTPQCQYPK